MGAKVEERHLAEAIRVLRKTGDLYSRSADEIMAQAIADAEARGAQARPVEAGEGREVWIIEDEHGHCTGEFYDEREPAEQDALALKGVAVRYVPAPSAVQGQAWIAGSGIGLPHGTVCIVLSDDEPFLREFHPTNNEDGGNWWPLKGRTGEMFRADEVQCYLVMGPLPPPPPPEET